MKDNELKFNVIYEGNKIDLETIVADAIISYLKIKKGGCHVS